MLERKDVKAMQPLSQLHCQWGRYFNRIQRFQSAIDTFKQSLQESEHEDLKILFGLCETLINFTRYNEAVKISSRCLEIDPANIFAKWMRVETLYNTGEFGNSLVHAHRGERQCRYPFENAIHRANETVENCIGYNTLPDVLVALLPWMKKLEAQRKSLIAKLSADGDEFEDIDEDHSKFRVNDLNYQREHRMKKFRNMLIEKYLETLAIDTFFIEKFLKNPAVESANKKSSKKLIDLAQEFLMRSIESTEVHRIRKPLYVYHFGHREIPAALKRANIREKKLRKYNIIVEANSLLMRLHEARMAKDYPSFFMYVDRVKNKFDSYSERMFPMKQKCLNEVYKMVGRAYLDPRDVTKIPDEPTRIHHLKHHIGWRDAMTFPRDSDLGWVPCALPTRKKALEKFRKRLALASQPLELAWLNHEFAKLQVDMGRIDAARFYAKKSRDASLEANDDRWVLNANHMLIRIEVKQRLKNEAHDVALLAYLGAKKIGIDYLVDFYKRIVKLIDDIDLDRIVGLSGIAARERLIMDLMPNELKREMDLLIQRMNFVPAKRRLSLMPGCKPIDYQFDMPCKRNTIQQSLRNSNSTNEAKFDLIRKRTPSREILGWMDFEDYQ
ncbi:hypothetical protein PV325_000798 [Microctonus aethiopoides]|uniref:Uncharacterized protein n=1 Tax=Microctonus aethiopoides TaxID=144406 RepID=A0AA39F6S3_9HYME|nr:hypothetical protein PV325_000798 [Microctonus aethiopoides]KAK0163987.1 hypothetical protein PV328_002662 [Microctonus aethiopoides]